MSELKNTRRATPAEEAHFRAVIGELAETNFLTRWMCHVCGGRTEKDPVLAEGRQDVGPRADGNGRDYRTIRVCDQCLR